MKITVNFKKFQKEYENFCKRQFYSNFDKESMLKYKKAERNLKWKKYSKKLQKIMGFHQNGWKGIY
ncbi:MAG: hypothetical protein U0L55_04045, partial [Acutalibacteraceae bacterium]|nr:hypothetical protein [Acutalibacteraceae bacterium]